MTFETYQKIAVLKAWRVKTERDGPVACPLPELRSTWRKRHAEKLARLDAEIRALEAA